MNTPRPAGAPEDRVRQFDGDTGEFIAEHDSVEAAVAATGVSADGLRRVLRGYQLKARGFRWTSANEPPPLPTKRMSAARHDVDEVRNNVPHMRALDDLHAVDPPATPVISDVLVAARYATEIRTILAGHGVAPGNIHNVTLKFFEAPTATQRDMHEVFARAHAAADWNMVHVTAALISSLGRA